MMTPSPSRRGAGDMLELYTSQWKLFKRFGPVSLVPTTFDLILKPAFGADEVYHWLVTYFARGQLT